MANPFDNSLVNDIRKMITEQDASTSMVLAVNGINAKTLDFTEDFNDPTVQIFGYGSMKLSTLKKDIQKDVMRFAEQIGRIESTKLLAILTDIKGKFSSNMYIAFKLQALADVEEFMKRPDVKRKITMIKKRKQGG
jgi:hypothetical protein